MTSINEEMKRAEEAAIKGGYAPKGGGTWFKAAEGTNVLRILTPILVFNQNYHKGICYDGCGFDGSPKGLCYVLHQNNLGIDGGYEPEIKLATLPGTIVKQIGSLQEEKDVDVDPQTGETKDVPGDNAFTNFPAPYDIKYNAEGVGVKTVKYSAVTAGKNRTPVSQEILDQIAELKPLKEVFDALLEKDMAKNGVKSPQVKAQEEAYEKAAESTPDTDQPW